MAHDPSMHMTHALPTLTLAEVPPFVIGLAVVLFIVISLLMMLVVLIQKPQGGGLSGAFGAGAPEGSGQTAFGAKTGDVLTTATIGIFVVFIGTAVALNFLIGPPSAGVQETQVAPTTPAAPTSSSTGEAPGNFTIDITEPVTEPAGGAGDGAGDGTNP